MKGRPVVLGYIFSSEEPALAPRKGVLPLPVFGADAFAGRPIRTTSWNGYTATSGCSRGTRQARGISTRTPDDDGIVRRVPMLAEYEALTTSRSRWR